VRHRFSSDLLSGPAGTRLAQPLPGPRFGSLRRRRPGHRGRTVLPAGRVRGRCGQPADRRL